MSQINVKPPFIWKSLELFEKALLHFKKASIPLKMSSKSPVILEKPQISY
jgi:hypothetical protein